MHIALCYAGICNLVSAEIHESAHLQVYGVLDPSILDAVDVDPPMKSDSVPCPIWRHNYHLRNTLDMHILMRILELMQYVTFTFM